MAVNDNLGDFLTSVANAIRTKKGTSASINAQNFASEIANLPSGAEVLTGLKSVSAGTTSITINCSFNPAYFVGYFYDSSENIYQPDRIVAFNCWHTQLSSSSYLNSCSGMITQDAGNDSVYLSRQSGNIIWTWNGSAITITFRNGAKASGSTLYYAIADNYNGSPAYPW